MKKLICPYCGDEKSGDEIGCCGESRAHFEEVEEENEEL